jgi:eukaryotic-like serine/threonine-protein kinase
MPTDTAEITGCPELAVGTVVGGKYRVTRAATSHDDVLTCEALHAGTGRAVRLDMVARADAHDAALRLARAGRAAGSASHGHLLGVIDSGSAEDGRLFVVYEHFAGVPASQLVAGGSAGLLLAAEVVHQLCAALGPLHRRGVVHRALRPENVLIAHTPGGVHAKLTGFELAVVPPRFADPPPLPRRFSRFAAPEARRSPEEMSAAIDVFALGVLLRYLASGSDGPDGQLDATAARIVERATAPEPDARYLHVEQLGAAVALLLPERVRAQSVVPADPLLADLRHLQKLAADSPEARVSDTPMALRAALAVVEAVYARLGKERWVDLVRRVPRIEGILPRPDAERPRPDAVVSTELVAEALEAADALVRREGDAPLSVAVELGAAMAGRGLRRVFPAYPVQLSVPAWLDSLPALFRVLFPESSAVVTAHEVHGAALRVQGSGVPRLALAALFAGVLRAELAKLAPGGDVRIVASRVVGDEADVYELQFGEGD